MKTILVINRPQIEAYWTLPFLFLKIQTNYNKVLEAEDEYWLKNIAKHLDSNVDQREMHRIAEKHQKDIIIKWLK